MPKSRIAKKRTVRIIACGGGTASHVYPTLQVLNLLGRRRKIEVVYIGTKGSIEEKVVPPRYNFTSISAGKVHRFLTLKNISEALRTARGLLQAGKIIRNCRPDLIFSKGGFAAFPVIAAAGAVKVPIVAHESDSVIGLANRFALKRGGVLCVGYPLKYYPQLDRSGLRHTGIPIRRSFFTACSSKDRQLFNLKRVLPTLLVTGGSQGALPLNNCLKPLLSSLLGRMQIIHLTGEAHIKEFIAIKRGLAKEFKDNYHPFGYIHNGMEAAVKCSDIILSRAGSSMAEFAAAEKPMILVPLPSSANSHQSKNAEIFARKGAAINIRQKFLTPERLRDTIHKLLDDPERLKAMAKNSASLAVKDATDRVVRVIEENLERQL